MNPLARPQKFIKLCDLCKNKNKIKGESVAKPQTETLKCCRTDEVELITIASHYDTHGTYVLVWFILFFCYLLKKLIANWNGSYFPNYPIYEGVLIENRKKPSDQVLCDDSHTSELKNKVNVITSKAAGTFIIYAGWGTTSKHFEFTDAATCWVLSHNGKRIGVTSLNLVKEKGNFFLCKKKKSVYIINHFHLSRLQRGTFVHSKDSSRQSP